MKLRLIRDEEDEEDEVVTKKENTFWKEIRGPNLCRKSWWMSNHGQANFRGMFQDRFDQAIYSFHAADQRGENNSERARALS